MSISSENQLKYENYKEQFKRLNRALDNGFNLEAIFIEYAILEDRTESILRHAEKWEAYIKHQKGRNVAIDSKIKYIIKCAENKKDLLHKYFSDGVLESILVWKEERNRLIHALLKQQLEHKEVSALALQGQELVKLLRAKSGNYNRAVERKKAKIAL
ncbi:MAG: hypothetical protein IJ002_04935 [Clostridia bacterium]|nr:hypothetical protein [Clostridia bacterium]